MMRIAVTALAVITAFAVTDTASAAAPSPTPAGIEASIREHGAEATIAALAKADQWDVVADKIGDGNSAWIAVASELAPGSDAGSAEDLGISLAFSLPKNPHSVLAALDPANGHILGVDRVCGMPFIEDTVKDRLAYKRQAIRAVEKVTDTDLKNAKKSCLAALRAAS